MTAPRTMQTYNLKKKDWLLKMNLIINNMSMKALSLYFQLNCGIHLKNLDSSKKVMGTKLKKWTMMMELPSKELNSPVLLKQNSTPC